MSRITIIKEINERVFIRLKIKPQASENKIITIKEGMVHVAINAIPDKNKANRALITFLSKQLKITKKEIIIESGLTSRIKTISLSLEGLLKIEDEMALK